MSDPVGIWFEWITELMGEPTEIVFGRVRGENVQTFELPHSRYDGVSGLRELIREHAGATAADLPSIPLRQPPSRWIRLRESLRLLARHPIRSRGWALRREGWKPGEPRARGWAVLTEDETRRVAERARARGVSVNSQLLHALNLAVEPWLAPSRRPSVWMIPVSVHPRITLEGEPRNMSSFIDLDYRAGMDARAIESFLRRLHDRGAHWGNWVALGLSCLRAPARLLVRLNGYVQRKTGVFTNVGRWGDVSKPDGEAWFALAPVMEYQPFGASALTWKGRLTLAVQLHPSLSVESARAAEVLARWKGFALEVS